jgi:hypothetical protein
MTVTLLDRNPGTPEASDGREPLIGLSRSEFMAALARIGVPEAQRRMRSRQLWRWIYNRGATSFDVMSDIAKDVRDPPRPAVHPRPAGGDRRAGVDGRHPQVAAQACA